MKIDNEFTVDVPIEEAWKAMLDLERVAPCLPGAAITGQDGDDYQGTMTVKIGPITARYKGTVKFEETDDSAHRAVLNATGRDARGQGTASATITSSMEETADGTQVKVETDMKLTGKAAQFGRGIAQDVAEKMLGQFAECLEQRLSSGSKDSEGPEEVSSGSSATTPESSEGQPKSGVSSTPANSGATVTPGGAPAGVSSGSNGAGQEASGALARPVSSAPGNGSAESGNSSSSGDDSASSEPKSEPKSEPESRKIEQEEPEPLDLGEMSQDAVLKRVKPVLIGAGVLVALVWLFRRIRN